MGRIGPGERTQGSAQHHAIEACIRDWIGNPGLSDGGGRIRQREDAARHASAFATSSSYRRYRSRARCRAGERGGPAGATM